MNPSGIEAWLPIIITLATAGAFTPLIVAGFHALDQLAGSIKDDRWRAYAKGAVHWVEQTLTNAPDATKKDAAVKVLTDHGVPADRAGRLVESAVSQMRQAASAALATAAPVVVNVPPLAPPAQPATPPPPPLSILAQLAAELAPLVPTPPANESSSAEPTKPLMAVQNIAVPPGLPTQPPTPLSNGTAGDTPAEPVGATGATMGG